MRTKKRIWPALLALMMLSYQGIAQTTVVKGLTVAVDMPSAPFPESADSVSKMMNQPGFSGWGQKGSVRDFYYTQSDGKYLLTSTAIKVHLVSGDLKDLPAAINEQYPEGFTDLTLNPDNSIFHFNVMTKVGGGSWAFLPQGNYTVKNNGVNVNLGSGHLVNYAQGQKPEISVICHELGHNIFGWPDHYQTAWSNLGNYCIMGMGGSELEPTAVNPGLRLQKNWINNVIEIGNKSYDTTITAVSNSYNTIFKYTNPYNPKEYLLIHPQVYGKYYPERVRWDGIVDQGLAIWYVDELGGPELQGQQEDYFVKLIAADNQIHLNDEGVGARIYQGGGLAYTRTSGDYDDLFDNVKNTFPNGTPFRWKDGGEFGLNIGNISAPDATMTFTVYARTNTFIARSDQNGTISPKGVINATNQLFTFLPNPGYEINTVKVNGAAVTPTGNQYTLTGASGPKTIEVTYKRKATQTPLPSGWTSTNIGVSSQPGFSAENAGKFYVESYGSYVQGTTDNCNFLYQAVTGDVTLIAHLAEHNRPTWEINKIGLMLRASLATDGIQSLISRIPFKGVLAEHRTAAGGSIASNPDQIPGLHVYELYNYLKIQRSGNTVTTSCSRDGITWKVMSAQSMNLPQQVYIGLFSTGAKDGYAARAIFDNVQLDIVNTCIFSGSKLTGTSIGDNGSWNNSGATREKAFDNDIHTYYDALQNVAWTGLDLGSEHKVTGIRFVPREGLTYRMINGKFQGSNTADFSTFTDLYTVTADPAYEWNCAAVSNTSSFRYVRYLGPVDGGGNVSEIEFIGSPAINPPPTISITSPAPNTSFNAPANITIVANAADANGTVSKVEFFNGTTLLGTDNTSPYSYAWSNVAAGTYSITAKATDNAGATTSHIVSNIIVVANPSPTVNITSPAANTSFNAPATITITANAADANGTVSKVEFFNGTTLLGTDITSPYSYTWSNVAAGTYSITAKATDNLGAVASHVVSNITVINPSGGDISGPNCGSNNSVLLYEITASKRVNANNYNWWFDGSAQGIAVVSSTENYKAKLTTGTNFGAGQVCVGISYNGAPYYTQICKSVTKCSGAREDESDLIKNTIGAVTYQNPFTTTTTITFPYANESAGIQVFNADGLMIMETSAEGSFELGNDLKPGFYVVRLNFEGRTETVKLIKE